MTFLYLLFVVTTTSDESSRGKLSSLPTVERGVGQGVGPSYLSERIVEASGGTKGANCLDS